MKIVLRATIVMLSLGISSAYAESEVPGPGGPPFTSIPGTRTVTGFGGVAIPDQSGAVAHSHVATQNGGTWLHRTTRSVSVTDSGRRLLERLRPAIDQIADALDNLD